MDVREAHEKLASPTPAEKPVRRWQCADGCRHLVEHEGRPGRYDCHFWFTLSDTMSGWPLRKRPCGIIPKQRIHGPHTDQPTLECQHFEVSA